MLVLTTYCEIKLIIYIVTFGEGGSLDNIGNLNFRNASKVSVPCSSLSMVVTVRCGHCTSLLSVNMMKTSFVPLHLFASLSQDELKEEVRPDEVDAQKALDRQSPSMVVSSDTEDEEITPVNHVINKPPEKRQRAPSAYNRFIKEEIRRLKNENPNMTHKEAFSTAAKNWAHFPAMQEKEVEESKERSVISKAQVSMFSNQSYLAMPHYEDCNLC
ncbi:hypothetical protein L1049_006597 [Liquidambar formosana]|uniref:Axial regulator YABBY 4 n=1 Tax=Liquidambar formosana TaxID=63359 RepID=A0AAP0WUD2_LIQFO